MSTATLELYNALVDAGVDKEKAEAAAKAVISKEMAHEFATKSDIAEIQKGMTEIKSQLIVWMAGFHIASLGMIVALLGQF
ncbi:MAG: hypothetical protein LR017_03690 [Candidatus Pacebacteria bacterium]|nr:hypothetical protein [Candidatus Paceibacterota bacterium]